jgi:nuclear pore complex protein Nup155
MVEMHTVIPVTGKTWSIIEAVPDDDTNVAGYVSMPGVPPGNELARTLDSLPRHFLVLTNSGLTILLKSRPIEQLELLLSDARGNSAELAKFVEIYGASEVCCMCLALSCNIAQFGLRKNHVADSAVKFFLEVGGQPKIQETVISGGADSVGRAVSTPTVIYSGRHDGIALFVTRALRSVWNMKLIG